LHFDLRLELDGVFKSWAVTKGPSLDLHDKRLAVEVEDHPLDYGDFEGTIPKGQYGGGTAMVWDRGYWDCEDPERAYTKGKLDFTLEGEKLHGGWILTRTRKREGEKRTNWLLIKHRDEFAREGKKNKIFWTRIRRLPQADRWTRSRRVEVGVRSPSSQRRGPERPQKRNGNPIALPREHRRQKSGPVP
jgi:DNA ligase D-like protein (predicted 3'-phosphoesterase)